MIYETRQAEIRRILQSSSDLESLYQSFLSTISQAANAELGIAWDCTNEPRPICQTFRKGAERPTLAISEQMHNKLLRDATQNSQAFMVRPTAGNELEAVDPNQQSLLLFGPVKDQAGTKLVELVVPGSSSSELTRELLRDLNYFCVLAADFKAEVLGESNRSSDGPGGGPNAAESTANIDLGKEAIDQFTHSIHESLELDDTLRVVVNEARRVLDCDRVSVAIGKGSKFQLAAISGQASVNKRSNTTQLLQRLASKALATKQTFWYPNEEESTTPQILKPLNEYLGFSETRSLAIVPVFAVPEGNDDLEEREASERVVAGIVVEHCSQLWAPEEMKAALEPVCRHASNAIRNALDHRSLFGYTLWRALGKSKLLVAGKNLPKSVAVAVAVFVLIAALVFVPAPFTLHGEGVLVPTQRHRIFATVEGEVDQIHVAHRATVRAEDRLLSLKNDNLELRIEELEGELATLETRLGHEYLIHGQQTNRDDMSEQIMQSNSAAMEKQKESLNRQLAMLRDKLKSLEVTSPVDGEVITWDVEDRLSDRPVKPGELLLEVADVGGTWEVELDLPERRVGHLLRELEARKESGLEEGLRVVYQPAAEPGAKFEGRIIEIARSLRMTSEKTQVMRVLVEIDTADIDKIRQFNSGVSAKIYCGQKPLGYVWLHELFEFVQAKILFRVW